MCGIMGYVGELNAVQIVYKGLEKLEYRGYDSVGIAYKDNFTVTIAKEKGRVMDLAPFVKNKSSDLAIGHTRWATHGEPNQQNAHPHCSNQNQFILVHNGIIENYQKLKVEYLSGYSFKSQTDTEIIVNLIEYFALTMPINEAIRKTMSILEGSYACLVLDKKNLNCIYFFCDKNPLLLGIGKNGIALSSDITGLVGVADQYIVLEDKTFGIAYLNRYSLYDLIGLKIDVKPKPILVTAAEIDKKTFHHFMLKEIYEQPMMIRSILHKYFIGDEENISMKLLNKIRKCDKINIVACGTSMYAGMMAKYFFEKLCFMPAEVFCASELIYSTPLISKRPFFIFYSQSGETADVLAVMKKIKKQKFPMLAITNNVESSMGRLTDFCLDIYAGKEIAVASTKAYTAMIVVSAILARAISGIKTNLKSNLKGVSLAMEKVLHNKEICLGIAKELTDASDAFYIGRGIDYWVSLEGALKLKEISYIHTEAFPSGELKHGPIALIHKDTPVIAIITQEGTNRIIRSNLTETISRGAKGFVISSKSLSLPEDTFVIPNVAHYLSPLVSAIVVQLIAYYTALLKHNDIDKPKNLAKCVTVE